MLSIMINYMLVILHTWTYVGIPICYLSTLLSSKPKGYEQSYSNILLSHLAFVGAYFLNTGLRLTSTGIYIPIAPRWPTFLLMMLWWRKNCILGFMGSTTRKGSAPVRKRKIETYVIVSTVSRGERNEIFGEDRVLVCFCFLFFKHAYFYFSYNLCHIPYFPLIQLINTCIMTSASST